MHRQVGKSLIQAEKKAKAKKYSLTGIPTTTARKIKICFAIAWSPCYYKFMIQSFRNKGTEDIFNGKNTKNARKICPQSLWKIASRKLDQIDSVQFLEELRIPPGNNLESLSGDRIGENSIRINDQYRICFKWAANGPYQVEITDYH